MGRIYCNYVGKKIKWLEVQKNLKKWFMDAVKTDEGRRFVVATSKGSNQKT